MRNRKVKTNGFLTQKDIERGICWFISDHAHYVGENLWQVSFQYRNQEQLISRIYARASGIYRIKDDDILKEQEKKATEKYFTMKTYFSKYTKKQSKIDKLPKWKKLIVQFLNNTVNKIINSYEI